jgi:uncharacterized protein (DUF924 family)
MSVSTPPRARRIAAFWRAAGYDRWFAKSDLFDALTRMRLLGPHERAAAGAFDDWDQTPVGVCALLILLDQAPRNLFRGTARSFATDGRAVAVAATAIARGFDRRVTSEMRWFFYLPFEHAEDMALQRECVELFRRLGDPTGLRYAEMHADIIARFGRFPHRNAILGRRSTDQEAAFLAGGGFAG